MTDTRPAVATWPRKHFVSGGGHAQLFYVAFGKPDGPLKVTGSEYRCAGLPKGLQVSRFGPDTSPDQVDVFRQGYLWDELGREDPALHGLIAAEDSCFVVRGEFVDPADLDYFRDTIGLLSYLLDHGFSGIYDPFMFRFWSRARWRRDVFDPAGAVPRHHVMILASEEDGGTTWFHTRGLLKFGRPDLSVPGTPPRHLDAVVDLVNRFIEFQALGGIVEEHHEIVAAGLPAGMRCHHAGHLDDPDFNNVHVRIDWPR